MKKMIFIAGIVVMTSVPALAQKGKSKTKATFAKADSSQLIRLESSGSFSAKAASGNNSGNRLTISDPTISLLNERAEGNPVTISSSGIVGMPKRAYGFANGRIFLRSTVATTSGTSTGTPSVGTGNSLSAIGSTGSSIGLNGKTPDAGASMWGNALRMENR